MFGGLFILTACSVTDTSSINTVQQFNVDTGTSDQGPVLRLLTQDGNEKIEIFDGQFADGTKILESVIYELRFNKWNQTTMKQSSYIPNAPVIVSGGGQFGVLEVIDPNIIRVDYETQKDKRQLSIIQVKSRRFVAYHHLPGNNEYYQIRGVSKDGDTIWQLFPEEYWKK
ncbi:hypothetical protein Desor_2244 [Desulfosporosinus orientis DSM 765]|uniref:Uncharacterized protein n=1 Tax=Desulfosporosinus orientis (strain ATCC 19365 / DSM 765 / NCIMB 8382 / VKM B-1628 / Singapore I) TaxID=768706 RepID=G7WB65_DESOD|nr:hypothetical protein [Desulfosporosinus orientis]AET67846.1 hypothetical protein Desor_2244 [Desulfosporosinus orientis DSM 765]